MMLLHLGVEELLRLLHQRMLEGLGLNAACCAACGCLAARPRLRRRRGSTYELAVLPACGSAAARDRFPPRHS